MSKLIKVSDRTHLELSERGTLTDTFDSVIQDLLHSKTSEGREIHAD